MKQSSCDFAAACRALRRSTSNARWFLGLWHGPESAVDRQFPHCLRAVFAVANHEVFVRGDDDFSRRWSAVIEFWRERFFLADGWPKYYHDGLYPADAHAAARQSSPFWSCRNWIRDALTLAEKIAAWTIQNLRDDRGFFYYQRRRFYTVRTPFMRWTQAWMLYALARLLEAKS